MKKIITKKVRKISKIRNKENNFVTKIELREILNEQTKVILEAVSEIVETKVQDGVRQGTAFTELKFADLADIIHDDREMFKEKIRKL
jgi:hypothetical protein